MRPRRETGYALWLLESAEFTQRLRCRAGGGPWCRGLGASRWHQPGPRALQWPPRHCVSSQPAELVSVLPGTAMLICLSLLCPLGQVWVGPHPGGSLSRKQILSRVTPGCESLMGALLSSRRGSWSQLLVSGRMAGFVCTLINSPLKCWGVWMAWLLGDPKHAGRFLGGSCLFIVLLLLVGIDPRLPAQGQGALPSINPRGLKDLERSCSTRSGRAATGRSLPWNSGYSARPASASSAPLPFPGQLGSLPRSWTKSAASSTSA